MIPLRRCVSDRGERDPLREDVCQRCVFCTEVGVILDDARRLGRDAGGDGLSQARISYFTSSKSPGFQVLSNHGCKGA